MLGVGLEHQQTHTKEEQKKVDKLMQYVRFKSLLNIIVITDDLLPSLTILPTAWNHRYRAINHL